MIHYTKVTTDKELAGILQLQKQNLSSALTKEEMTSQGFVTVEHRLEDLKRLNNIEPHIIGKDGERVISYALAMTAQSGSVIPVLQPMFNLFEQISFANKKIADYCYMVVGQVCVDHHYRGKGIFDNIYLYYCDTFKNRYAFAITEIAANNTRSMNAHKRIGFQEIHRYTAPDEKNWVIVLWDWNNLALSNKNRNA